MQLLARASEETPRLEMLGAAAARATDADGAAVLVLTSGAPEIVAKFGWCPLAFTASDPIVEAAMSVQLFVSSAQSNAAVMALLEEAGVNHFVSSRFETKSDSGLLCVFGTEQRGLSSAQEYVLHTLAREVADQLDFATLRSELRWNSDRLRLLESVVVNANDAVLITESAPVGEPGPRILYANAAFTRTTGFELEDVIGKTPRILQGPNTDPQSRAKLREALVTFSPIELELVNYRKDGTPFWVELSIVPVADETGWWTHWVSVQRDVTERKAMEEAAIRTRIAEAENAVLSRRVFNDDLTGMHNRAYFMDRLNAALQHGSAQPGSRIAVIFLDLDRFKVVNDSLGHHVGDLMLVEIARRLHACIRPRDILARMGGDEFTVLLEDDRNHRASLAITERIIATLAEPIRLAGHDLVAAASIGICYAESEGLSPDMVLRNADLAMYRAKAAGGRRYAVFDESMHERASAIMQVESELRLAMAAGQFELYYQPLVQLPSGVAYGVESLIRWNHPTRGAIGPADFITIAEETGLIVEIGSWVLRAACEQLLQWEADGLTGLRMSVNVSGRQLYDESFRGELLAACYTLGPHVKQLQLELTESVLLERSTVAGELMQWVRWLGVRIAIDDFGTGYSSLSYLIQFEIDTMKIDGSFTASMNERRANVEVVRNIIALGRALGMEVVAEGIERESQCEQLVASGCACGQGYFFGQPLPACEIKALIARE